MARSKYSDDDKARVFVALTVHNGNVKRAARETTVPVSTVRSWRDEWEKQPPNQEMLEAALTQATAFVANAERARDLALSKWEELVEKGDVKAKDLMVGVGILTDKINLAKGLATSRSESHLALPSPEEMRELAESFVQKALEAARTREEEIIDAEWKQVSPKSLPSAEEAKK